MATNHAPVAIPPENDAFLRKKAKCYAHFLYRNTEIEEYHAAGKIMDAGFYEKIRAMVSGNLRKLEGFENIADKTITGDRSLLNDIQKMNGSRSEKADAIYRNISFNMLMGAGWDDAVLKDKPEFGDISDYILGGCFKQSCEESRRMTDENMKLMNIDIHDRIYTLLVYGYL